MNLWHQLRRLPNLWLMGVLVVRMIVFFLGQYNERLGNILLSFLPVFLTVVSTAICGEKTLLRGFD